MIVLAGKSLIEKEKIIAKTADKYAKKDLYYYGPKNWKAIFNFIIRNFKYRKEKRDILYEPPELLRRRYGDCEDLCCYLAALLKKAGYKVKIRLISNATKHVYVLVFSPAEGWIALDPSTKKISKTRLVPAGYKIIGDMPIGEMERILEANKFYKLQYRVTGVFEVLSVSKSNFLHALNKAREYLREYGIEPVNSGVYFDAKNMIGSVYIKPSKSIPVSKWNDVFIKELLNSFGLYRYIQFLRVHYIGANEISKQKAKTEVTTKDILEKLQDLIKIGLFLGFGIVVLEILKEVKR
ncbi:MAG TPA: transglutaminase domain-containing protein [Candidatus Desulfofervidus auxilii]|uniref:Transglutaminase domain-containing protein n=1 Tax=Desulfofervidus auxilii TaxID=1621989 RepID=A0A7C0U3E2_DESA2|nr:transglutaminase domain-containing protein [Candidatus Desulfofervidus auxilii]